jgi:hypothetical protein
MRVLCLSTLLAALPLMTGCASSNPAKVAMDSGDMLRFRSVLDSSAVDYETPVWAFNLNLMEYAACKGKDKAILEMLAHGADVNKGHEVSHAFQGVRYSPLTRAIGCNADRTHPSTVKLLLDHGAQVDAISMSMVSEKYNDDSIVEMVRDAYERQHGRASKDAGETASAPAPRPAAARLPPENREPSSDVDAPSRRNAERPNDFALVIGIEEYQSLPKAEYGARDAQTVRKHFEAIGVPARNIISLEGSQATGSKLRSYLQQWLPRNVKPESTVFVYYSGHGAPDPESGDAYLVPWDADPMFLTTSAYPLKQFYAELSKLKAKRVVVALDACFSGSGGRSVLAKGARPLVAKVDESVPSAANLTVLAAASGSEITGTLEDQAHGIFTYYFLKGLSGGAATPRALYNYLKPRVQDDARRQNREQSPTLAGSGADASF